MTKTIEEAMKSIAKDFIMENKSRINNDAPLTHECVQYTIERIFAMPLSSRITPEEKERVRRIYMESKWLYTKHKDSVFKFAEVYKGQYELLESIFGADFFKEGE